MFTHPTELAVNCPSCDQLNELLQTSISGLYQGYCISPVCGEWFEFNYDEALALEEAERQMDAQRDERYEQ